MNPPLPEDLTYTAIFMSNNVLCINLHIYTNSNAMPEYMYVGRYTLLRTNLHKLFKHSGVANGNNNFGYTILYP